MAHGHGDHALVQAGARRDLVRNPGWIAPWVTRSLNASSRHVAVLGAISVRLKPSRPLRATVPGTVVWYQLALTNCIKYSSLNGRFVVVHRWPTQVACPVIVIEVPVQA